MNWISVKDRLPENKIEYLICDYESDFYLARWDGHLFKDEESGLRFVITDLGFMEWADPKKPTFIGEDVYPVTHWMPLPKPPEE